MPRLSNRSLKIVPINPISDGIVEAVLKQYTGHGLDYWDNKEGKSEPGYAGRVYEVGYVETYDPEGRMYA